jgi:hypothetical protein
VSELLLSVPLRHLPRLQFGFFFTHITDLTMITMIMITATTTILVMAAGGKYNEPENTIR